MKTLVVTGAARGIGHVVAKRALERGDTVFAVVRKAEDSARFLPSARLHVVVMDMGDTASVQRGFAEVDRLLEGKHLDQVVHSAAISVPGAIELTEVSDFERHLNTNTLGSLRVLKASIPRLRGHGGRIVLLTSLWGRASGPMLSAYCASKHAIESLADTARRESAGMGLHIIVAEPGVVRTDMYASQASGTDQLIAAMSPEHAQLYGTLYRRYRKVTSGGTASISADQCAASIEKALSVARPRTRYRIGTDSKAVCFLAWLLPDTWMDALLGLSLNRKPLP